MGGEAQKLRFHLEPGVPEPPRPEPPGVGMWGLVVHMVLMVPLVPTTILNAVVAVLTLPYLWRALGAPGHGRREHGDGACVGLLLVLFLVVMVVGLALLATALVMLARTILDHRLWRAVLLGALGMLVRGRGGVGPTGTARPRRRRCSGSTSTWRRSRSVTCSGRFACVTVAGRPAGGARAAFRSLGGR